MSAQPPPPSDSGFVGFDSEQLPTPDADFSVKDDCKTNPDVVVDIFERGNWIRLPVVSVEQRMNRDGPADITRTAKVTVPSQWGNQPIDEFIDGFRRDSGGYDKCRIYFRDQRTGDWEQRHYGYVGGVGPAADAGQYKLWVYDVADLCRAINCSKSFNNTGPTDVAEFVIGGEDARGEDVGLEERSVIGDIDVEFWQPNREIYTEQNVLGRKSFEVNRDNLVAVLDWCAESINADWFFEPRDDGVTLVFQFNDYTFDNIFTFELDLGFDSEFDVEPLPADIQRQQSVTIAPEVDTGSLNVDGETGNFDGPLTRAFIADELDIQGEIDSTTVTYATFDERDPIPINGRFDLLDNNALLDIKPFNTIEAYGATFQIDSDDGTAVSGEPGDGQYSSSGLGPSSVDRATKNTRDEASSEGGETRKFPYAKVQYPPLINRAGGYEYTSKPLNINSQDLGEVENRAKKEFHKHLEEVTEGSMTMKGNPQLLPGDFAVAAPVCNDTYTVATANPITWEVNSVRDIRASGEQYKTEIGCALSLYDGSLDVESYLREA